MYFAGFCLRLSGKQIARYLSALMATTMNTVTLCSRGVRRRVGQSQGNKEFYDRSCDLRYIATYSIHLLSVIIFADFNVS